ncbi:MAG: Hsp20/alpha crystallin family protein [Bacilli bacterium]|nr:Hsp20/alpha crystallin family protein [Bacilli bacterium]
MNRQLTNRYGSVNFWDPFFAPFFEEGNEGKTFGSLQMKTDIKELEDHYEMAVELPGFDKKDIALRLEDGYLTITAEVNRSLNEKEKKGNFIHRERFSGKTSRSYYVGEVEKEAIKATYENGVLLINLPKENPAKVEASHAINIQ